MSFKFVHAHNKQKMRLTITICQSQYFLTENFEIEDSISHQQIKMRVDQMLESRHLQNKTAHIFFVSRAKNEEVRLRGDEKFRQDTQIVVRFDNDYKLMQQEILMLTDRYQDLINSLTSGDPDIFGLNRTPLLGERKPSLLNYTTEPDVDLCILVSNPLVRSQGDGFKRIDRTPVDLSHLERSLRKCLTWTQLVFMGQITIASKKRIQSCKHGNPKIVQLMCDTAKGKNEKIELLLEHDLQPGLEERVTVDQIFEGSQRPTVVVVIGNDAFMAAEAIQKLDMDCIAINSTSFSHDRPANNFLQNFYKKLFVGKPLDHAFRESVTETLKKQFKLNELCCCYHQHRQSQDQNSPKDCQWEEVVKLIGKEAAHLEMHHLHGSCTKKPCKLGCPQGKSMAEQLGATDMSRPSCINLCCCFFTSQDVRKKQHDEELKFRLYNRRKWKEVPDDMNQTEVIFKIPSTKLGISRDILEQDYLLGRNDIMFELAKFLSEPNTVTIVKLNDTEGKSKYILRILTKNAVAYLMQRNYPLDFVEIDLKGVTAQADFKLRLRQKLSEKTFKIQDLIKKIQNKKLVILFSNIEEYLNPTTGSADFIKSVTQFVNNFIQKQEGPKLYPTLPRCNLKIVFVKEFQNKNLLGEKTILVKNLDVPCAVDLYLRKSAEKQKNQSSSLSFNPENRRIKLIHQIFKNMENSRPLTQDLIERIVKNVSKISTFEKSAQKQMVACGVNVTQLMIDETEISRELKRILLFIREFPEGLSQKDLNIMANIKSFQNVVPKNWEQLLLSQIKEGNEDGKQKLMPGKYFYFDVMKKRDCNFVQIKAKSQRLTDPLDEELTLQALQYLSIYTIMLIKYFRQSHDYHEHLFEYSNATETGVFYYRKFAQFKQYFDVNEYLPAERKGLGMLQSANGRRVRLFEGEIFANQEKLLEQMSPERALLQHQDNLLAVYLMRDRMRYAWDKYVFHYYYSLLLNIPTLMLMMTPRVSWELVAYCIEHSIECAKLLPREGHELTQGLLLLKLYYMDLGLKRIVKPDQFVKAINQYAEPIDQLISLWSSRKMFELKSVHKIEHNQRLLLAESDGRVQPAHPSKFLSDLVELYQLLEKLQKNKKIDRRNFEFIRTRVSLYTAEVFRLIPVQYEEEMRMCCTIEDLLKDLENCKRIYSDNGNVLLFIRASLASIYFKIKLTEESFHRTKDEKSYSEACSDIKKEIDRIAGNYFYEDKLKTKITDTGTICFFDELVVKINSLIWNFCNNLFVFMKSEPLVHGRVSIRAPNNFKKEIEMKFDNEGLNIATIFRTLTKQNLKKIIQNGCLLLVLTVDCQVLTDGSVSLILEDSVVPSAVSVPLSQLRKFIYDSGIDTILVWGANSIKMIENLSKNANDKKHPSLFALDTNLEGMGLDSAQQYFIRAKQQQIATKFIRIYCERLLKEDAARNRHNKAFMKQCIDQASKKLGPGQFEHIIEKYMPRKFIESNRSSKEIMKVQFAPGSYKDASGETLPPHNLTKQADPFQKNDIAFKPSVGRSELLLSVLHELTHLENDESPEAKTEPLHLNLYGVRGIGKKTFLTDVAWELVLKNVYEDGVFLIDCDEVIPDKSDDEEKLDEYSIGRVLPVIKEKEVQSPGLRGTDELKLMTYIEQQVSVLFRKLHQNSQLKKTKKLKMIVFLCNVNRLVNFENDEFLQLAQQKGVKIVFSSTHKTKMAKHKILLPHMTYEEAAAMVYTYLNPSYVFKKETLNQGLEKKLLDDIIEPGANNFVPSVQARLLNQRAKDFPEMYLQSQSMRQGTDQLGLTMCRSRKLSGDGSLFTSQRLQGSSHFLMDQALRLNSELDSILANSNRPSYRRKIPLISPSGKRYDEMNK